MTLLAIVADDLTGAADAGAHFAGLGFTTSIHLRGPVPGADVVVCSTESRHLPEHEAIAAVEVAMRALLASPGGRPRWLLKKIDSALRGTPAGETLALARVAGVRRVLVAPALPAQGRTTVDGRVLCRGVPVDRAGFEVPSADLLGLFRAAGEPPAHVPLAVVREGPEAIGGRLAGVMESAVVADAETDADLQALVEAAMAGGYDCFAGSAGLASAIAERLPAPRRGLPPGARRGGPVLVLAGSRHEATAAQVDHAARQGVARVVFTPGEIRTGRAEATATEARGRLAAGESLIVTPPSERVAETEGLLACFADLGEAALAGRPLGGLVLTGGDVAAAVCARLGVETIELRGEVLPAIPWGRIAGGRAHGLDIVTKAGSFGDRQALARLVDFLAAASRPCLP
jgi:uncharacterized protein YgbK (DUF1537 family)